MTPIERAATLAHLFSSPGEERTKAIAYIAAAIEADRKEQSAISDIHGVEKERDDLKEKLEAAGMRWPQTVAQLEKALESFPAGRIWLLQWTESDVRASRAEHGLAAAERERDEALSEVQSFRNALAHERSINDPLHRRVAELEAALAQQEKLNDDLLAATMRLHPEMAEMFSALADAPAQPATAAKPSPYGCEHCGHLASEHDGGDCTALGGVHGQPYCPCPEQAAPPSPAAREATTPARKTFDCVMRDCPACGGTNVEFRLEDREIPYGGVPGMASIDNPDQLWLKCHAIVQRCGDCTEEFMGWQSDAIVDAAALVYKENISEPGALAASAVISSNRKAPVPKHRAPDFYDCHGLPRYVCECGTVDGLHEFGRHPQCEYLNHHCDECHKRGACTAHDDEIDA